MILRLTVAALMAFAATACAAMPGAAPDSAPPTAGDRAPGAGATCAADAYQVLVGQRAVEVDRASLPAPHRVYGPGDAVTMDYRPDRLNIVVGEDGTVVEVKCG